MDQQKYEFCVGNMDGGIVSPSMSEVLPMAVKQTRSAHAHPSRVTPSVDRSYFVRAISARCRRPFIQRRSSSIVNGLPTVVMTKLPPTPGLAQWRIAIVLRRRRNHGRPNRGRWLGGGGGDRFLPPTLTCDGWASNAKFPLII